MAILENKYAGLRKGAQKAPERATRRSLLNMNTELSCEWERDGEGERNKLERPGSLKCGRRHFVALLASRD